LEHIELQLGTEKGRIQKSIIFASKKASFSESIVDALSQRGFNSAVLLLSKKQQTLFCNDVSLREATNLLTNFFPYGKEIQIMSIKIYILQDSINLTEFWTKNRRTIKGLKQII